MWFDDPPSDQWQLAVRHLARDPTLRSIIDKIGPCGLRPTRGHFAKLVQSILSQQVSVKAAASMYAKLASQMPGRRVTPTHLEAFLRTSDETLIRACGLSRQKRAYVTDLAERFARGSIRPARFASMSDDEIVAELTRIKGVGRWTAEMLLIFALNRPDVWPVDDLAIRESVMRHWPERFPERPAARALKDFADDWRPWRSIASWYLWRGLSRMRERQ
jgi:DNA-3-methyladenine glycosylase II